MAKKFKYKKRFAKVRVHTFCSNKYKIKVRKLPEDRFGQCDDPTTPDKAIAIDPNIENEHLLLETVLDEAIHACNWSLDNDSVGQMATDMAKFLARLGWTNPSLYEDDGVA